MVWTKKAAAPAYANLAEKVEAIIIGGPDAWLLPWFDLVPGNNNMDVAAFCALGPPDPVTFGLLDFVGFIGGSRLSSGLSTVTLAEKISQWAFGKLFEAYCEEVTAPTGDCVAADWHIDPGNSGWGFLPTPDGVTSIRIGNGDGGNVQDAYWCPGMYNYGFTAQAFEPGGPLGVKVINRTDGPTHQYLAVRVNAFRPSYVLICGTAGSVVTFTPPAVSQPASAVAPTPGVYTTIAQLGAELDHIERKLHWVLDYTANQVVANSAPLVADDLVDVVDASTDIPLDEDVAGFILTVSNIPAFVDETFPDPKQLHRLGRVFLGNGEAWAPPIEVSVSPMLILKQSTFHTAVRVQINAPATATVTKLVKAAPVG